MHGCAEIIHEVYSSRIYLQDHLLEEADWNLYAYGSSYMDKGHRKAGYAIVTLEGIVESKDLPLGTSTQKTELIGLKRALGLSHAKRVNVYTNSRYLFLILCAHSLIWKERGLLTSNKKEMKHAVEMLKLLEAVQVPLQVAVMHFPRHQTEDTEMSKGNNLADGAAKEAAKGTFIMPLLSVLDLSYFYLEYSFAVLEKAKGWGCDEDDLDSG